MLQLLRFSILSTEYVGQERCIVERNFQHMHVHCAAYKATARKKLQRGSPWDSLQARCWLWHKDRHGQLMPVKTKRDITHIQKQSALRGNTCRAITRGTSSAIFHTSKGGAPAWSSVTEKDYIIGEIHRLFYWMSSLQHLWTVRDEIWGSARVPWLWLFDHNEPNSQA